MTSIAPALSHSDSSLILPTELDEPVKLVTSIISEIDAERSGSEYLAVFVKNDTSNYGPNAIQGRYSIQGGCLQFSPYFPFETGLTYVVRFRQSDALDYSFQEFQLGKKPKVKPAKLLSVYPSGDQLPENLLRFYLYFNTPMKKGEALKHISLINSGTIDKHAFMEFKQELWSPDGKRLTILFDPGRIKRGVSTNLKRGPALLEGKRYQLAISADWQDVYEQPLQESFTKDFVVDKPYREAISLSNCSVRKPMANSKDVIEMEFDRVMDHALAQGTVHLEDEQGHSVAGRWETSQQERVLQFVPEETWKTGNYKMIFDTHLEDLAGNNLNGMLDQMKTSLKSRPADQQVVAFSI